MPPPGGVPRGRPGGLPGTRGLVLAQGHRAQRAAWPPGPSTARAVTSPRSFLASLYFLPRARRLLEGGLVWAGPGLSPREAWDQQAAGKLSVGLKRFILSHKENKAGPSTRLRSCAACRGRLQGSPLLRVSSAGSRLRQRGSLPFCSPPAPRPPAASGAVPAAEMPFQPSSAPRSAEGSSRPGVTTRRCPPGPTLHPSGGTACTRRSESTAEDPLAPGLPPSTALRSEAPAPGSFQGPVLGTGSDPRRCPGGRPGGGALGCALLPTCHLEQPDCSPTPSHRTLRATRTPASPHHLGGRPAPPRRAAGGRTDHPTDPGGPARPSCPADPAPARPPVPRGSAAAERGLRGPRGGGRGQGPRRRFARSGKGQTSTSALYCAAPPPGFQDGRRGGAKSLQPFPLPVRAPFPGGKNVSGGNALCRAGAGASSGSGPERRHPRSCDRPETGPVATPLATNEPIEEAFVVAKVNL